jgi:hypothetical protein
VQKVKKSLSPWFAAFFPGIVPAAPSLKDPALIDLASPYTPPDPMVREQQFRAVCRSAAALLRAGHLVFAPIMHSHPLVEHGLPTDWPFGQQRDHEYLLRCDEVRVLMLNGWRASASVQSQIRIATDRGKPVRYPAPEDALASPTLAYVATETPG